MFVKLKKWWTNFNKSPELKYLEQATDHYDLERRMKNLGHSGKFRGVF